MSAALPLFPEPSLGRAIAYLAGRCDGARTLDGHGFNAYDTEFGHSLADQGEDAWSPKQRYAAWKMSRKYRGQLMAAGIDWSLIPEPDDPMGEPSRERPAAPGLPAPPPAAASPNRVTLEGGSFTVVSPYNPALVTRLRDLPRRLWNPERRAWLVANHPENYEPLQSILEAFKFAVDPAVASILGEAIAASKARHDAEAALEAASRSKDADIYIEGLGGELRPFQKAGVAYADRTERTFIADEQGLGKEQPVDEPVLTPRGWRPIGDLQVGDEVIGANGQPTAVVGVFPQGRKPIVRVTMTDGSWTRCGWDHLWSVTTHLRHWQGYEPRVKSTRQMVEEGLTNTSHNRRFVIPMVAPVEGFVGGFRPLNAWLLGALIGDGGLAHSVIFSTADDEMVDLVRATLPPGVVLRKVAKYDWRIAGPHAGAANPVLTALRDLGLHGHPSPEKFIPTGYLQAPLADRIALLQGLLDTDGHVRSDNNVEFCTSSERLAADVRCLIQSLGGTARIRTKTTTHLLAYRMSVILPPTVAPFRLARKAVVYHPRPKYPPTRAVAAVEADGEAEAVCIRVAAADHLYVTRDHIVTHNTVQALALLEKRDAFPALIVCPATLKPNWRREAEKWLPDRSVVVLGQRPDLFALHAEIVIINYEALSKFRSFLRGREWAALVADESHYMKSPRAIRTTEVRELVEAQDIPIRLLLTGTPVMNRPDELISQLGILGRLDDFGGLGEFRSRYVFGMRLKELNDRLRRTCFVRRLKADVLTELPPKINAVQTLQLTNRGEYDSAEADVIAWVAERASLDASFLALLEELDDDDRKVAIKQHASDAAHRAEKAEAIVRINALKLIAAKGKLKAAVSWITDFLESGEKLVVFAEHVELQAQLCKAFPGCASVLGGVSPDERQRQVDRFQNDPGCRLVVCSMAVASLGITLTAASDVAILELGWTPAGVDQATDRCHRIGQTDSVTAWHLLAEDTIDEWVSSLIDKKRHIVTAATDGADAEEDSMLVELMAKLRSKALS